MNVLVTGATGFLGKAACRRLMKMGYTVTGLGRNRMIGMELEREGIRFFQADLEDRGRIMEACSGQQLIVHCGALSSPWGPYDSFYRTNVLGTEHMIEGALRANVERFVHISTPSLYFHDEDRVNVREDQALPQKFMNHYTETKFIAEQRIDDAFARGLPVITLRPRALFGPEDNAIIPRLIEVNRRKFIPFMNPEVQIDLTYVENVVDAICLSLTSEQRTLGQKYNITNGEPISLVKVLQLLFERIGEPLRLKKMNEKLLFRVAHFLEWYSRTFQQGQEPTLTRYTVTVLAKTQTLNIEKARQELGYEPKISIEEGIELFAQWWKGQTDVRET